MMGSNISFIPLVENSETEGHPKNDALSFIASKHGIVNNLLFFFELFIFYISDFLKHMSGNNDDIHIHAKSCNIKMSEKIDVEGGGNHISCSIGIDSTVKGGIFFFKTSHHSYFLIYRL